MIVPSDRSYIETKQIMLGERVMDPAFKRLAQYIDETFGVRTINIISDAIDNGKRCRLEICFEFEEERRRFYENGKPFNYDTEKRRLIAAVFCELQKHGTEPWVIYSAFEPNARMEANENVPQADVLQLKKRLSHPDLWEISRSFAATTFFVYTDEQVKRYKDSETHIFWSHKYFDLLETQDPFGYFKRETYRVYLDSKENFDSNYESNWYYYYK